MKNKIKILIIEPIGNPYEKKIEHKLETMQNIVGGLIEFIELEQNVDLICNEQGKINNLPMNRIITNDVICGTFFIAGQKNGETISLTEKQIKKYKKQFNSRIHTIPIAMIKSTYEESSNLVGIDLTGIEELLEVLK